MPALLRAPSDLPGPLSKAKVFAVPKGPTWTRFLSSPISVHCLPSLHISHLAHVLFFEPFWHTPALAVPSAWNIVLQIYLVAPLSPHLCSNVTFSVNFSEWNTTPSRL